MWHIIFKGFHGDVELPWEFHERSLRFFTGLYKIKISRNSKAREVSRNLKAREVFLWVFTPKLYVLDKPQTKTHSNLQKASCYIFATYSSPLWRQKLTDRSTHTICILAWMNSPRGDKKNPTISIEKVLVRARWWNLLRTSKRGAAKCVD